MGVHSRRPVEDQPSGDFSRGADGHRGARVWQGAASLPWRGQSPGARRRPFYPSASADPLRRLARGGSWLREHAPPNARVLTRHSDVGFTSGLLQESVRFEELPPQAWRTRLAKLHARFLVVPASVFGKFFPFDLLASDPTYAYAVRWKERDVAIVEVLPNRSGRVTAAATDDSDPTAACGRAAAEPWRVDLSTRCAELLAATGRRDDAIARLGAIVDRGGADVRETIALGQLLLSAGRADDAAAAFRAAAELPEAELLEQVIERGRAAADRRIAARDLAPPQQAQAAIERGRAFMDALRWKAGGGRDRRRLRSAPTIGRPGGRRAIATPGPGSVKRRYDAAGSGRPPPRLGAALADALTIKSVARGATPGGNRPPQRFGPEPGPGRALDILERATRGSPATGRSGTP